MESKVRKRWENGEAAVNGWLTIPSPVIAEIVANRNFDSVTIDMQHGLIDYQDALSMLQALRASGVTPIVRVLGLDPVMLGKVLDAGALGVICPMVNTRAAAEQLVRSCKYPPGGNRSFGPLRSQLVYGSDYAAKANSSVIVFGMIETEEAVANVSDIAETPGLDGLYIGPSDLSLSFGGKPVFDHEDGDTFLIIEAIRDAAHNANIKAGIHCVSPSYAKRMLGSGFDFVTAGADVRWFGEGLSGVFEVLSSTNTQEVGHAGYN